MNIEKNELKIAALLLSITVFAVIYGAVSKRNAAKILDQPPVSIPTNTVDNIQVEKDDSKTESATTPSAPVSTISSKLPPGYSLKRNLDGKYNIVSKKFGVKMTHGGLLHNTFMYTYKTEKEAVDKAWEMYRNKTWEEVK